MDSCTYSPQISPGNNRFTPPSASGPTLVDRSTIVLSYPFTSPTTTLTLRNPELNNKLVPKISRIQRQSRGNELITYRDPIWPKNIILNWSFRGLTKVEAEDCLDFCLTTCGRVIRLLDYESRNLQGIITNPANPISQESKNECNYTFKLDFQGVFV